MKRPHYLVLLWAIVGSISCSRLDEAPAPANNKVFPTEGAAGSYAMLKSSSLASALADNIVQLGPYDVTELEKRNDTLIFQLPADIPKTSLQVKLTANGKTTIVGMFTVKTWSSMPISGGANCRGFTNGPLHLAKYNTPSGLVLSGSNLYVIEAANHAIRRIDLNAGTVYTVAGNGDRGTSNTASEACLNDSYFLTADASGNLIASSSGGSRLVRLNIGATTVTGLTGVNTPSSVTMASNGDYLVGEYTSGIIRRITPTGEVSIFSGTNSLASVGSKDYVRFPNIWGMLNLGGDTLLISDRGRHQIRIIEGNNVRLLAGTGTYGSTDGKFEEASFGSPSQLAIDANRLVYLVDQANNTLRILYPFGYVYTIPTTGLYGPIGVASSPDGRTLYVASSQNTTLFKYTLQ